MDFLSKLKISSEKQTGLSDSEIQNYSPEQFREYLEKRNGRKVSFISEFPIIGRGNVLRNSLASSEKIDFEIERILQ